MRKDLPAPTTRKLAAGPCKEAGRARGGARDGATRPHRVTITPDVPTHDTAPAGSQYFARERKRFTERPLRVSVRSV